MIFAGQFVLRLVIPIWGFFAGFAFGAGLFAGLADERFLGTVLGWVTGFVFALIFALFAYLYYAVAVILAMAGFGFAIGSGLVVALGIDWNWVAVLVGVVVGAVLGLVSIFGNMPMIVLAVASSIAGAVSVVAGLMLVFGSLDSADFTRSGFTDAVHDQLDLVRPAAGTGHRRHRRPDPAAGHDAPHRQRDLVRREPLTRDHARRGPRGPFKDAGSRGRRIR